MKFELKSIGYWSVIKVSFIVNLIVGFIVGFFYAIFVGMIVTLMSNLVGFGDMPMFQEELSIAGLMILPFIFAFGGAVFNTILALIVVFVYNMIGKLLGGLELELSEIRLQPVAAGPSVATYASAPPAQAAPPPPPPVQPLPPDMRPPDTQTDNSNSPPKKDEGI